MVQKSYVIDSVTPYSDRRGVSRLTASLIEQAAGATTSTAPMGIPLNIVIENPSDDDKAQWAAGNLVTADFTVTPVSQAAST